jgi:protein tyrosine/serine phosphatase
MKEFSMSLQQKLVHNKQIEVFKQIERKKLDTEITWDNFKNEATAKIFEALKDSYLKEPVPERKWKFEKYKRYLEKEREIKRKADIK